MLEGIFSVASNFLGQVELNEVLWGSQTLLTVPTGGTATAMADSFLFVKMSCISWICSKWFEVRNWWPRFSKPDDGKEKASCS